MILARFVHFFNQVITGVPGKGPVKASPNKAAHHTNMAQPSSTTQPSSHSRVHADSSKKEKVSVQQHRGQYGLGL